MPDMSAGLNAAVLAALRAADGSLPAGMLLGDAATAEAAAAPSQLSYAANLPPTVLFHGTSDSMVAPAGGAAERELPARLSGLDDVLFDFASGLKITSVMAVLQTNPSFFGTLTSNKTITSPKDFCNQTYGGFGYPGDPSIIAAVIQGAGGPAHCNVPVVTLGSSAYQAVESHKVGFSAFFFSDVIQAEVQQHASLRVFNENNYGVPNQYAALILGNNAWLAANPALAHKFVNALVRAYTYIKNNPAEGARIEYEMNPTAVNLNVAIKSSEAMAKSYLVGPSGQIGIQNAATWQAFGTFLYKRGAFTDSSGQKLTHNFDWGGFMTNKYL